jgi:hypothetical protein
MDTSHTESYEIIAISNDYSQMQISSNTSLKRITNIIENILQQSVDIMGYSTNIKQKIRTRMTEIFKQNKTDYNFKFSNIEEIVFLLFCKSITSLRIPYNQKKMLRLIQFFFQNYRR